MNVLSAEKRLEVFALLVNGSSIRATERVTNVHRDTIMRFGVRLGEGCQRLHDRLARELTCSLVDVDEQHSWCGKREKRVDPAKDNAAEVGEQWTWAAICRTSKFVIAWHVGKRDQAGADMLIADVRARLTVMPQITSDGLALYPSAIATSFGRGVDYAQMVKNFSAKPGKPGTSEKFSVEPGVDFITKRTIFGAPDLGKATTYAIERNNCTARQWNARLHRRTLSFSKKLVAHRAAVARHYVHQNFCHIPRNMRETAAMAAGIASSPWTLAELLEAVLNEPEGEKPEPQELTYRKPETTARELPNGRGFIRIVSSGGGSSSAPASPPTPPAPVAPATPAPAPALSSAAAVLAVEALGADATWQSDLLPSRPCPREPR